MNDKLNIDSNVLVNELLEQVKNLFAENLILKSAINQIHAERQEPSTELGDNDNV